jgi:NitT/TauT family transport system substrate-binding protein
MRNFYRLVSLILALGLAGTAQAQTRIKFILDWRLEGQTSFMWLGLARGYFKQEGLDVQVDAGTGSTAAIQRIDTGAYDMGLGDMSALIEYYGNFPDQRRVQMVYLQYDEAPLAFYALKKSGARSIADLAGKSVASTAFDINRKLFPVIAKAAKIDPGSVSFVFMDPALRTNAVVQGNAFAVAGFYQTPLEFEARGVKRDEVVELKVSSVGVRLYGNGALVSTKLIAEDPKAVRGFVRAMNRAFREMLAEPQASIKALKAREPLADEKADMERLMLLAPAMLTERTRAEGMGAVDQRTLESQIEHVASTFGLKTRPTPDMVFNSSFLPPKAERMPLGK